MLLVPKDSRSISDLTSGRHQSGNELAILREIKSLIQCCKEREYTGTRPGDLLL